MLVNSDKFHEKSLKQVQQKGSKSDIVHAVNRSKLKFNELVSDEVNSINEKFMARLLSTDVSFTSADNEKRLFLCSR
jgi:hypothetical protein